MPRPAESDLIVPTAPVSVVDTHVSWLLFVGDRVYKAKKAVRYPFVDLSTRERRRRACIAEVELNRRLAPDVYLGVGALAAPSGEAEPLVVMRRLPPERALSRLVTQAEPDAGVELSRVARLLARFHAGAERSAAADAAARAPAVAALWLASLDEMDRFTDSVLDRSQLARAGELALAYVAGRALLLAARVAAGRCCDGHGDLLADDVFCLPDGPRLLDCLEFDDRLRRGDALVDACSLAMDVERLGRPDLAAGFLSDYRRASGDWWPPSLAHHWIAYRALVRAKVACLRWEQGDDGAAADARHLLALAVRHLEDGAVRLVLVGGLPGTGKSTLAAGLGAARGWAVLRSDVVRKELAGLDPTRPAPAPLGEGLYRAESTATVYAELLQRAGTLLAMGQSVVLDATWALTCWRQEASVTAARHRAGLVEIRCQTADVVATERIRLRQVRGGDASDATPEVAAAVALFTEPWPTAHTVDTAGPLEESLEDALRIAGPPAPFGSRSAA